MFFTLGTLTGLVIMGFILVFSIILQPKIERRIHQVSSRVKEKGKVLEDANEVDEWVESLKHE